VEDRRARVLVVDDEPRYIKLIQVNLEASGYEVLSAPNGQAAVALAAGEDLDLILLDIMLPGKDGFITCAEIRAFSDVPIVMLTALGRTEDIIRGLDAGADDYIVKPFSAQELLARIRARLRRRVAHGEDDVEPLCRFGSLHLDLAAHRLYVDDNEVHLTNTEFRLLTELATHAGKVLVLGHLLERVWGAEEEDAHLLWQAIHRLRHKIEADPSDPQIIQTRPGIGYLFSPETRRTAPDGEGPAEHQEVN
jgi:two-component system, OmpR family, KDP operon response regulator KdpE